MVEIWLLLCKFGLIVVFSIGESKQSKQTIQDEENIYLI